MKKGEIKTVNILAILAIFIFSGAGSFMNAAVQTMMEAWPQLSATTVRLVTSLPSLVSIPVTILIGMVAGKKLSYRFCAIFGTALIMAAGAAPAFIHMSWGLVLFFRALVGVGVGFVAMRNSLIIESVPDDKQAAVIGYGAALMNGGAILAGPLVGVLVTFGWNYAFLYDLLALIPIIFMILFLKEPKQAAGNPPVQMKNDYFEKASAEPSRLAKKPASAKEKLNWRLIYYIVVQFIMTAALYPLLSGMSTYMAYRGIGNAVTAGFSNSTYNIFGVLVCMVMSPIEKKLGKNMLSAMSLLFAVAMALIVFCPKLPLVLAGAAIAGIAFNSMMGIYQLYNGKVASPAVATLSSTLLIASLSLGNFVSVYYINFCHALFQRGNDIESTYFGSMIVYLILAAVAFICKPAPEEYYVK